MEKSHFLGFFQKFDLRVPLYFENLLLNTFTFKCYHIFYSKALIPYLLHLYLSWMGYMNFSELHRCHCTALEQLL